MASSSSTHRKEPLFDLIVYGATSFTANLVCRYLATKEGLKWAAAGRSKDKIIQSLTDAGIQVPIIVADSYDEESLLAMAKQTKCIISAVGPYALYGALLVKVCAENGVHYVDLCAEASFMADQINLHTKSALATKAILLFSCGFDSIPSDIATFYAVKTLMQVAGDNVEVGKVTAAFSLKGAASGGTLNTILNLLGAGKEQRNFLADPFCLSPSPANYRPSNWLVTYSTFRGKRTWGALFFMAPHNAAIVRRTWGLLQNSGGPCYSPFFEYTEFLKVPGPIYALVTSTLVVISAAVLVLFSPARWALRKLGPKPGQGPSTQEQLSGWFRTEVVAKDVDGKFQVKVDMLGSGDPGYSATSVMVSEAALAIVQDYDSLPPLARQGGFLTPATALGMVLIERLEKTGRITFEVDKGRKKRD